MQIRVQDSVYVPQFDFKQLLELLCAAKQVVKQVFKAPVT